jgi:hypothetical protein
MRIGPEQVAEIVGDVALEEALDETADLRNVLRRDLDVLPPGDRQDGDFDPGQ